MVELKNYATQFFEEEMIKPLEQTNFDLNKRPSSSTKAVVIFGLLVVGSIFIGLGGWAATAPLAEAISAVATLAVKGERKKIQHFEGGIISALHVTEGQFVNANDLLVSLNPLQATATMARNNAQLNQALVREARLQSELLDEETIIVEGQFLERLAKNPSLIELLGAEQKHLEARRETKLGHIAILNQRIDQLNNEIKGLEIQRASRLEQYQIFEDEIIGLRELHAKGYYPKTKLLAVERAMAQLRGAAGTDLAKIARAESSQQESENQIVSVSHRFRESVVGELGEAEAVIADFNERVTIAGDILKRVEVKAPRSGIVQGIQVHTVGGVVTPGAILMEIAPQDDDIVVNAIVMPNDVDSVAIGQIAEVRLTALNFRTTPSIYGVVASVSGDSLMDQNTNQPFFLTRISIPAKEREKLGEIHLTAGMPADVLIKTGERTALDYLIKPLTDAFKRGLNEE
jgi:HlyD family secretion protein/epimerase transport system membrane fusion protein